MVSNCGPVAIATAPPVELPHRQADCGTRALLHSELQRESLANSIADEGPDGRKVLPAPGFLNLDKGLRNTVQKLTFVKLRIAKLEQGQGCLPFVSRLQRFASTNRV